MDHLLLKIVRVTEIEAGTFGVLMIEGGPSFVTAEPNWRNNGKNSCIPAGVHACKHYSSEKYPDTLEIVVPGRGNIIFHSGNVEDDSLGCVLLGRKFANLNGKFSIAESSSAVSSFKAIIKKYKTFRLTIVDATK